MKRGKIIILIVCAIMVVFCIFIYIYIKQNTPKYDWFENYSYKSKEPYGSKLLYDLLKKNAPSGKFESINKSIEKQLPLDATVTNYFFIGNYIMEDTAEMEHLLHYVENGNKAFVFTNSMPRYLMQQIAGFFKPYDYIEDSAINLHYPGNADSIIFKHRELKRNVYYNWHVVESDFFADTLDAMYHFIPLSYIGSNHVNYFSVKYGKGTFYFNATPILFSNYHLITEDGYKYAKKCFANFHNGTIYWDERNKITTNPDKMNMPDSGPLRYIISQKNFSWAWYLGLVLVLLYVFFRSKREQRMIPIINPVKNTSLEYNKAISLLYFQSKDNSIIADEIMKMFLLFIKNKYGISIRLNQYDIDVPQLSVKSGISENKISDVFQKSIIANYGDKTDKNNLINFHQSIEYFYKNCK